LDDYNNNAIVKELAEDAGIIIKQLSGNFRNICF
jgi:hypothetical protein